MGQDIGLNLVLTLTDRVSSGLQGVTNSLIGMQNTVNSSTSVLSKLGGAFDTLAGMGKTITASLTAPIAGFMGKITQYGIQRASFVEDTKFAFTSLMGDAQKASDYMQELMGFAKTTPFTYEALTDAARTMVASGIDSLEILEKKADGTYGGILQAVGDAAGATGSGASGFQAMANALSNIKAEGKASGIRIQQLQRYGLQATKIIGNMHNVSEQAALSLIKNMDADTFIKELTQGIEEGTKGINGVTGKMEGMMANLKTTWTGAKDTFVSSLKTAGLELMGAYQDAEGITKYHFLDTMTESLNNISDSVKSISLLLQPIMSFVERTMKKGSEYIKSFADSLVTIDKETNTRELNAKGKIVSKIVSTLALAGPAMIAFGKAGSVAVKLVQSSFGSLASMLKSPMFLGFGGLLLAWKTDFLGLQSVVKKVGNEFSLAFEIADKSWNGTNKELQRTVDLLKKSDGFWQRFRLSVLKVVGVFSALKEAWDDNTVSAETFEKLRILGIDELVGRILDFKYRVEQFFSGFKEGWHEVSESVKTAFTNMSNSAKGTIFEKVFDRIENFFAFLSKSDPDKWKDFGKTLGKMAPGIVATVAGFLGLKKIIKPIKAITKLFGGKKEEKTGGILSRIMNFGGDSKSSSGSGLLQNPKATLKTIASVAEIMGGMALVVLAFATLNKVPGLQEFLKSGIPMLNQLAKAMPAIAIIGIAGAAVTKAADLLGGPKAAAKGLASVAEIIGGFGVIVTALGALHQVEGFDELIGGGLSSLKKLFTGLTDIFVRWDVAAFIAGVELLGKFGGIASGAMGMGAIAVIGLIGEIIGGLFGIFEQLSDGGFSELIADGMNVLSEVFGGLGKAIGSFIGGIAGGALEYFSKSLPGIGASLGAFGEYSKPFFEMLSNTSTTALENAGPFLLELSGALIAMEIDKLLSFVTGGNALAQAGLQLSAFAISGAPYFEWAGTLTDQQIKGAYLALASVEKIGEFKMGGLKALAVGDFALDEVGKQLSDYKTYSAPFYGWIGSMSDELLARPAKLFEGIDGAKGFTDTGFLGLLAGGDINLGDVGEELNDFAEEVFGEGGFYTVLAGIDVSLIEKGAKVLSSLQSISGFTDTGLWGIIAGGDNNLGDVGEQLGEFAENSITFWSSMSLITTAQISTASSVFNCLKGMTGDVFTSQGIFGWLTGGGLNIDSLSVDLGDFGRALVSFFFNVGRITSDELENAPKVFSAIEDMKRVGDAIRSIGSDNLSEFGTALNTFGTNISSFLNNVISANGVESGFREVSKGIETMGKSISSTAGVFTSDSQKILDPLSKIKSGFSSLEKKVKSSMTTSTTKFNSFVTTISNGVGSIITQLSRLGSAFSGAKFEIPVQKIKLPHFKIEGEFDLKKNKVPKMQVDWYAQGGVFDSPTVIGVGEQGKEAVMPLENNTGWIDNLASKLNMSGNDTSILSTITGYVRRIAEVVTMGAQNTHDIMPVAVGNSSDIVNNVPSPVATSVNVPDITIPDTTPVVQAVRSNDSKGSNVPTNIDNSVTFAPGSIVIQANGASPSEMQRMAEYIMQYIKRKQQLDNINNYGVNFG